MKRSFFQKLLPGVVAAALILALAGCGAQNAAAGKDGSLQKLLDAGQR